MPFKLNAIALASLAAFTIARGAVAAEADAAPSADAGEEQTVSVPAAAADPVPVPEVDSPPATMIEEAPSAPVAAAPEPPALSSPMPTMERPPSEPMMAMPEPPPVPAMEPPPPALEPYYGSAAGLKQPEERWEARNQRYQDLRERAAAVGIEMPSTPPWAEEGWGPGPNNWPSDDERRSQRERMMPMTPEEHEAARLQRYQEMRTRAQERGYEVPEQPPWKQGSAEEMQQIMDVIAGMSPEERDACHKMHRMHMMGRQAPPWQERPEWGMPVPETPMNPGYGYGQYPYGPGGGYRY